MQLNGPVQSSKQLTKVIADAEDFADACDEDLGSQHLLLALLSDEDSPARQILEERRLDRHRIMDWLDAHEGADEPVDAVLVILHHAAQFAERCKHIGGTLHLLVGICRVRDCTAYRILETLGASPTDMRMAAISEITGGSRRRIKVTTATPHADRIPLRRIESDRRAAAVALVESSPVRAQLSEPTPEIEVAYLEPEVEPRPVRRPVILAEARTGSRFALDPDDYPLLCELGRNLTILAEDGELDPLIGRSREVEQLVDILNKRRANNPCLIGDPGVGKTAIVEGLAQRIVAGEGDVGALGKKVVVELAMGSLLAGTQLRGAFSERLGKLKEEVLRADGRVILFIDEIHTLVGAGAGDGPLDAANELKTALARGEFPCIGATTEKEYRRHFESDPALARRFQVILAEEPDLHDALQVVEGLERHYSEHHNVQYLPEAVEAAVRLSHRWIHDRFLPAKAIDVLDFAGALAARQQKPLVSEREVAAVVAKIAKVDEDRLLASDAERLLAMEGALKERVIGHDTAMARIARVIRVNFAGFTSSRPMGSFLLLGPTGVGKTECGKVLAGYLFGSRDALTRLDMTEYADAHSVSRLIGAPPGFVGHEQGGQLTEAVRRRPYQILLFDEIEKASTEVLNVLLQLLEEGQVTDGRGRRVRFDHTVVILTSNLGWAEFDKQDRQVGFAAGPGGGDASERVIEVARRALAPELWNRIEEKLVFKPLQLADVERIAALLLRDSSERLMAERRIAYRTTAAVIPHLIKNGGFDPRHGARPMRRRIQELVEGAVADAILRGQAQPGATLTVDVVGGKAVVV